MFGTLFGYMLIGPDAQVSILGRIHNTERFCHGGKLRNGYNMLTWPDTQTLSPAGICSTGKSLPLRCWSPASVISHQVVRVYVVLPTSRQLTTFESRHLA